MINPGNGSSIFLNKFITYTAQNSLQSIQGENLKPTERQIHTDAGNLGDACDAGKSRSVVITGVFCSIQ